MQKNRNTFMGFRLESFPLFFTSNYGFFNGYVFVYDYAFFLSCQDNSTKVFFCTGKQDCFLAENAVSLVF